MFRFLWCLNYRRKLREHSIKGGGDLEKVSNRIVAIASMNTCKPLEQGLYKRLLIGHYHSVAYPVVSTSLPEGCSLGFVPLFLVLQFLQSIKSTRIPKHGLKVQLVPYQYHMGPKHAVACQ